MLNKSLLFSRLFASPHFLIGKDKKANAQCTVKYEKGDLLITNISNTFIVGLLSLRVTSRVACFFAFCARASLRDLA